jgi:hypothetical protein
MCEDLDLVQMLTQINLDQEIPSTLYKVVAELLAFVYRLNQIRQDEERRGERDPERLSRLEVEDRLELRGLLYWQVARLCTFQDLVDKDSGAPEHLVNIRGIGNEASCLGKGSHPADGGQPVPLPLNGIQYQNLL